MANEKRLIDANDSFVVHECNKTGHQLAFGGGFINVYDVNGCYICQFWAGDFPTVDAVEVVHGRWITGKCDHVPWRIKNPEKWVIHKCSVCGYSNGRKHSNYCPDCGAKMDGGDEDE